MILKLLHYREDKSEYVEVIDGFDSIRLGNVQKEGFKDDSALRFTTSKTEIAKSVMLLKDKELIKFLLIDLNCYYVYLLNDEGKTIERIN